MPDDCLLPDLILTMFERDILVPIFTDLQTEVQEG